MAPSHSVVQAVIGVTLAGAAINPCVFAQNCQPRWDAAFSPVGINGEVWDSEVFDDGTGLALFVYGGFTTVEGQPIAGIAKWDGRRWSEVGGGLARIDREGEGFSLAVWDDGHGPALYVGGRFDKAGTTSANNIARWDGNEWSALQGGVDRAVFQLAVYDDGRGPALYAGGEFTQAGGATASYIARWNGAEWEPLGRGLYASGYTVQAMTVFDDGSGSALYVGGELSPQVLPDVRYIARWNGVEWSGLEGVHLSRAPGGYIPYVDGLTVFDDGSGPALFIAGPVQQEGVGRYLLKWDGRAVTVPDGFYPSDSGCPVTMEQHADAHGRALWVAGGQFAVNSRNNFTTIARWDGRTWIAPESSPGPWIETVTFHNDGFGEALYVGGLLSGWQGQGYTNLTRWTAPHMALSHTPLRAGERALFTTTCSSPGQRVNFVYSTAGFGSFYVPQLGVTLDLDSPHLAGSGIADQDGRAELIRRLPPNSSGRTLYMQAAEQGRKSEVVEATIE